MSGGSYDYLCRVFSMGEALNHGTLGAMAERLEGLAPGHPVTVQTRRLADLAAEPLPEPLEEVWQAVEWHDSNDWDMEQVRDALAKHAAPEPVDRCSAPGCTEHTFDITAPYHEVES